MITIDRSCKPSYSRFDRIYGRTISERLVEIESQSPWCHSAAYIHGVQSRKLFSEAEEYDGTYDDEKVRNFVRKLRLIWLILVWTDSGIHTHRNPSRWDYYLDSKAVQFFCFLSLAYVTMAATLQPRLVRVVKPLLQVKKVKHFHRRTLSTISAFNYHHSSGPWANPFIHSSPFRYNPREFLQPAKFHASASRAILPAGPRELWIYCISYLLITDSYPRSDWGNRYILFISIYEFESVEWEY